MTIFGLDCAAAWVQCFFVHTYSHDPIEEAVWVDQTLLGRAPYLQGQSVLQGQPDFASVASVGCVLRGCSVSPAEQNGWVAVVHQC